MLFASHFFSQEPVPSLSFIHTAYPSSHAYRGRKRCRVVRRSGCSSNSKKKLYVFFIFFSSLDYVSAVFVFLLLYSSANDVSVHTLKKKQRKVKLVSFFPLHTIFPHNLSLSKFSRNGDFPPKFAHANRTNKREC